MKEMEDITSCKSFKEGDVLSWSKTDWIISGTRNTSKKESMDLENDVCIQPTKSYHLIPYRLNFDPESLMICQKISARVAGHVTVKDYNRITRYLSQDNIIEAKNCLSQMKRPGSNAVEISTWLGNDDKEKEGEWKTWYDNEKVQHAPWAPNFGVLDSDQTKIQEKTIGP